MKLGRFNGHDDILKEAEKTADRNAGIQEAQRVERSKKKIGEEGYLSAPVDIIDDDSICGYKKMLTDGTIVDIDDYVSATANRQLGAGSARYPGIFEQRRLVQAEKGNKPGDIMEFGEGGYSTSGLQPPEAVHAETRQMVNHAMRAAGVRGRVSDLD